MIVCNSLELGFIVGKQRSSLGFGSDFCIVLGIFLRFPFYFRPEQGVSTVSIGWEVEISVLSVF